MNNTVFTAALTLAIALGCLADEAPDNTARLENPKELLKLLFDGLNFPGTY